MPIVRTLAWVMLLVAGASVVGLIGTGQTVYALAAVNAAVSWVLLMALDRVIILLERIAGALAPATTDPASAAATEESIDVSKPVRSLAQIEADIERLRRPHS